MTRPMTGQPATQDELAEANHRANKTMNDDVPEDIKNHPLTKDSLKDDDTDEETDDEKLEDLREFRQTTRDEGNDELGVYGKPQTEDETTMEVTEDGETEEMTREEFNAERTTRNRTWERLARDGGIYVQVPRWFNDEDVNRVLNGRGFFGHKVGETDKALKLEVNVESTHTAEAETVWVPKSVVRTYELT